MVFCGTPIYSNNETDNRNITEILLKSGSKLPCDPDHDNPYILLYHFLIFLG